LVRNGMLQNDTDEDGEQVLTLEDRKQMSSIIDYVCKWHGPRPFSKWLSEDTIDSLGAGTETSWQTEIAREFGFKYAGHHGRRGPTSMFVLSSETACSREKSFVVTGYDHLIGFHLAEDNCFTSTFLLETDSCLIGFDTAGLVLNVKVGNDRSDNGCAVQYQLLGTLEPLVDRYDGESTPMSECTFMLSGCGYESKLILENIRGERESNSLRIHVLDGYLLLRQNRSDR